MTHCTHVSDATFVKVKNGKRAIEPRLNDDAHRRIRLGDLMLFTNRTTNEELLTKVVGVLRYPTFDQLFAAFPLRYFGSDTKEALHKEMHRYYTSEQETKWGVLGIKLHLLNIRE
ncbi:MAG: ASCH domain-containing protein [Candidatus Saccharimonadales bacterium]